MNIIQPTVGRKVWFFGIPWDSAARHPGKTPQRFDYNQPMDATIIYVWNDRCVNLLVNDHAGVTWFVSSATLVPPGGSMSSSVAHAEWMPYQVGQAAPKGDSLPPKFASPTVGSSVGVH